MREKYQLVRVANGSTTIRSIADAETFHPVIGPVAEAKALYINQLNLVERVNQEDVEFVVWDVGLGAAGNPVTFVDAVRHLARRVRIISFDHTLEPLLFALQHPFELGYIPPHANELQRLAEQKHVRFQCDKLNVAWELHLGDFPSLLGGETIRQVPKPHAIFYDAFSPQKNAAMWTLAVFSDLFQLLDPNRPCAMPTYSRSTLLRVTLLLAGFYVGVGHATGEKEETTIAANTLELIAQPLDSRWLDRARRSRSAEPLHGPEYCQEPLRSETFERLSGHPQFC